MERGRRGRPNDVVRFLQKLQPVEAAVSPTPPPRHPQSVKIGTVSQLLSGGIAGAFSKTCRASLARLTILFQLALEVVLNSSKSWDNKMGRSMG
ncbi:hypothetical protein Hdeb2414_s0018g00529231 [Helianthus debilis subsp. tardiflorus]